MGRTKNDGKGRLGGRAKGTPNKVTADLRGWISSILDDGRERFAASLEQLEPNEYIRMYTGLLSYVLPKQAPISHDEALRKEREMLETFMLEMPEEMVERVAQRVMELNETESYEGKSK